LAIIFPIGRLPFSILEKKYMSRTGITLEQVEVAAEHILSKGENPTIEKVRAIIGGTGSNTTISKYLQEWRSKRIMAEAPEFSSLKNPPDSVNAAVKHVWQQIREETDTEIEDIKKEATVLIAEAESKVYIAEKQSEKLLLLNHELQQQLYALQAKIEIQQLDFKKLQEENTLLHERNKGLDERYMQLRISVGTDTYFGLQADSDFGFARTLIPELTGQLYQVSLVLSAKILHVVKLLFSFSARNHLLIPV
jgi:hypothetical protein